jgi:hypothetical protein
LQTQYAADGVVVMEMLLDAANADALLAWPASDDYMVVRTNPPTQAQMDYSGFVGYPTLPLIDLQTMQVVNADCFNAASYAACIDDALATL